MNTSIPRRLFGSLAVITALALTGCSLMPERVAPGTPRAEIEGRLGRPTLVHVLPDGTRLQYSGQPSGQWVHNLDLGPDGRLVRYTQVMDAGWLQQNILIGRWTREDVLRNMGRPALVERVARFDGDIWTYRFLEATRPRQVHVHLNPAGVVRQLMFSDEAMYDDPKDAPSHPLSARQHFFFMNLIFAGTPEFARVALERLLAAGFHVPLVLTQPDRPAGRGMKLQASPVKQLALERHIAVAQPRSLRLDGKYPDDAMAARAAIEAAQADAMVVAAYGLILPQWVLDAPRLGCLNIHASLLPRWRGAAPIHRAIEAGDAQTGVTIMQMDAGLDTGDMLLVERLPIRGDDTTGGLHDRLAVLGGRLIVEALEIAACGGLRAQKQPAEGVTYAHKIEKAEAALDWTASAETLARRVRAFNPFPGAATALTGEAIKVWMAHADTASVPGVPGEVLAANADGIRVATGAGVLVLTELQRAGGKRLAAADFLHGFAITPGQVLDTAAPSKEGH